MVALLLLLDVDAQVFRQTERKKFVPVFFDFLHNNQSSSVQMTQSEMHTAVKLTLITAVSRVLTLLSETLVDLCHDFELKEGLSGHGLNVG